MNDRKKRRMKKLKRLKKVHIWPAIMLFLIFGISMIALAGGTAAVFTIQAFQGKCAVGAENAGHVRDLMEFFMEDGMSASEALGKVQVAGCSFDSAYLIDQDNEPIEGVGEMTALLKTGATEYEQNNLFFADQQDGDVILNEQYDLVIPYETVMKRMLDFDDGQPGSPKWLEASVLDLRLWFVEPTKDENINLIVKAPVTIYRRDLLYVVIIIVLIVVLLSLPVFLIMVNIVNVFVDQHRMRMLLLYDDITGGNNWIAFRELAPKFAIRNIRKGTRMAVADFELMKYRSYCACHGEDEGENLLAQTYETISRGLKSGEMCARYGRANFALLLRAPDEEAVKSRLLSLMDGVKSDHDCHKIIVHAGFYIIGGEEDGQKIKKKDIDIPKCYNNASAARATIPTNEDNFAAGFTNKLLDDQLWEHQVEEQMEQALADREFIVYYQPKYNPVTDELAGAEALIRWKRPDGSLVPPGRFIPIFENNGFITKIDDYMITNVARQQAAWLAEGKNVVPVSVNVSRAHFTQPDLAEHILELVDAQGAPHHLVEIELTESAFFDDKNALLSTVRKLKEYGFEISMDDFGAGYSSLNSLKDLPLDVLKLDADFFRGELADGRGEIVVSEAIALAKQLDMRIVAEGIEKKEQVDFLATAGCDMIQGYYFAKPMPAEDYEERMQQGTHRA